MDEEVFAFGSFRLNPAQRMLSEDGNPVHLGGRALDILAALTERAGETVTKEQLIARAWPDTVVDRALCGSMLPRCAGRCATAGAVTALSPTSLAAGTASSRR